MSEHRTLAFPDALTLLKITRSDSQAVIFFKHDSGIPPDVLELAKRFVSEDRIEFVVPDGWDCDTAYDAMGDGLHRMLIWPKGAGVEEVDCQCKRCCGDKAKA
jgi:hypothetical protein